MYVLWIKQSDLLADDSQIFIIIIPVFSNSSNPTAFTMSSLLPIQQACLNAYAAACALIPHDLRHAVIWIGGAGTIAHGAPDRKTEDTDIAVSQKCLELLEDAVDNRRGGFHRDADGSIRWDERGPSGQVEFSIPVELLLLGGPFVPWIPSVVSFREGYVAALPELVRLRAETLIGRGGEKDYMDLKLLLPMTN